MMNYFYKPTISIVVPLKDESESLRELVSQISKAISAINFINTYEVILIDDGSSDNSWSVIQVLSNEHSNVVKGIKLRRNFGKAIALSTGFEHAIGDIVITMDADLQDDPKEITHFLEKLNEGYDLVSGWKRRRYDPISKTLPSKLFNWVTAKVTGIQIHDFNCGFKCYKKEILDKINLYGELHRYVPVLAHNLGYRVAEVEVEHHARQFGVSKYGWERYVRGMLDLLTVMATTRWVNKPAHLFGGLGILLGLIGFIILSYLTVIWFLGEAIGSRPLLTLGVLMMIFSIQMISFGLIAEFFIRLQNKSQIEHLIDKKVNV